MLSGIMGIIMVVIGIIFFINGFRGSTNYVTQQTVQYLSFVCGSIFVVGGMIFLKLNNIDLNTVIKNKKGKNEEINKKSQKYCNGCGKACDMNIQKCPDCGCSDFSQT